MGPANSNTLSTDSHLNAHQTSNTGIKPFYQGQCDDQGRHHGKGFMKYSDGSTFKGDFYKGSPHQGVFKYINGNLYTGFLKDNKPHGKGEWIESKGVYTGQFVKGQFVKGQIKYSDGSFYRGEMRAGMKEGQDCFYKFRDGDTFQGSFQEDQFAKGKYLSKDKSLEYFGEFSASLKHGRGHLHVKNVADYQGYFRQDQFDGQGTLLNLKNKQMYQGTFKKGKKHGKGKLFGPDKTLIYDGQFVQNQKHGNGVFYHDKKKYQGQFKQGKFDGQGILHYGQIDVYKGQFKNSRKHGKGYLFLANNVIQSYEGQFQNDKFHGQGQIIYSNGDKFQGQFIENKRTGRGFYYSKEANAQFEGTWVQDIREGMFTQISENNGSKLIIKGPYKNGEKHGQFELRYNNQSQVIKENWINGKKQYNNNSNHQNR